MPLCVVPQRERSLKTTANYHVRRILQAPGRMQTTRNRNPGHAVMHGPAGERG
jgi:hypothetical protein